MKKIILSICISLFACSIFAESNISLPSEIIYGKTKAIKDTLQQNKTEQQLYNVSNKNLLNYQSSFSKKKFSNPLLYLYPEYSKVLKLSIKNKSPLYFDAIINDDDNFFAGKIRYDKPSTSFSKFSMPLSAKTKKYGDFNFNYLNAKAGWQNYNINLLNLAYTNKLNISIPYLNSINYTAGFSYVNHKTSHKKSNILSPIIKINTNASVNNVAKNINTNLFILKKQLAFQQTISDFSFLNVNNLGLYTALDYLHFYPSVSYKSKPVNIYKKLNLSLQNNPVLVSDTYYLNFLHKTYTKINKRFLKKPINLKLNLYSETTPVFNVYYKLEGVYDMPLYYKQPNHIYSIAYKNAIIHKFAIDVLYSNKNFSLSNCLNWQEIKLNHGSFMPYEPKYKNTTNIKYYFNKWILDVNSELLIDRKNCFNKKIKNACLINILASYKLYQNLNIEAYINNLLQTDNIFFDDVPSGGINAGLGAVYSF